jgi:hypothetical protein
VVIASLATSRSSLSSGPVSATIAVISGKIVIQVSSAILYGGGGAAPGWGNVNQVSSPVTKVLWMGPMTCGSARSSQVACSSESSQARRCSSLSNR